VLYIPQHRLCIVRQKAFGAPSGAAIGSHVLRATPHFVCRSYLSRKLNRPPAQSFFAAFARIFIARYLAAPPSRLFCAFFPIEACTMCENEWITAPSAMLTPGPITTNGSMVTSLPKVVSAARETVSGRRRWEFR
jgi:hypothetical protein